MQPVTYTPDLSIFLGSHSGNIQKVLYALILILSDTTFRNLNLCTNMHAKCCNIVTKQPKCALIVD